MITINAWFQRRLPYKPGRRVPRYENKNVQGMQFDVDCFADITPEMVRKHPMAVGPSHEWQLQGYCLPADATRAKAR